MSVRIWEEGVLLLETDSIIELIEYMTVNRVETKEINVVPKCLDD